MNPLTWAELPNSYSSTNSYSLEFLVTHFPKYVSQSIISRDLVGVGVGGHSKKEFCIFFKEAEAFPGQIKYCANRSNWDPWVQVGLGFLIAALLALLLKTLHRIHSFHQAQFENIGLEWLYIKICSPFCLLLCATGNTKTKRMFKMQSDFFHQENLIRAEIWDLQYYLSLKV